MHLNLNRAYVVAAVMSAILAVLATTGQVTWWIVPAPIEAVTLVFIYAAVLVLERAAREGGRVAVRLFGKVRFYIDFGR